MRNHEAQLDDVVVRPDFGRGAARSGFDTDFVDDVQPDSFWGVALKWLGLLVLAVALATWVFFAERWGLYALAALAFVCAIVLVVLAWPAMLAADLAKGLHALNIEIYATAPAISSSTFRGLPPDRRTPCDLVLDRPQSDYGAALRQFGGRVIEAADGEVPVIAIAAPRVADGGAVEALSLARTLASQGARVAAVDCDARLAGLTRLAGINPRRGIWEMLDGRAALKDVMVGDPRSSVKIVGVADGSSDLRDLFGRARFAEAIAELRTTFDIVILSCPSALNAAVTPVITRNSTLCVLVARWSRTSQASLRAAVRALRLLRSGPRPGVLLTETPGARP